MIVKECSNVEKFNYCYGCGVCTKVCSHRLISMKLVDGFYKPVVKNPSKCTECGLCLKSCAFNYNDVMQSAHNIEAYAAWSNDYEVRKICSSGGIGFEIASYLLSKGYKVIAVRYNVSNNRAEHYIAETVDQLYDSIGSKYIQSNTEGALKLINEYDKYLFIGTPCQVDSMKRYVHSRKLTENFVFVDFFCHGVPSMDFWDKYVNNVKSNLYGPIKHIFWRNKAEGWHKPFNICIDIDSPANKSLSIRAFYNRGLNGRDYLSKNTNGDVFYHFFFKHHCLAPQCTTDCKYKYDSCAADIRIGDLWGNTYKNNEEGVSGVVAFTSKGSEIIKQLDCITTKPCGIEVVAESQLKECAKASKESKAVFSLLKHNAPYGFSVGYVNTCELMYRIISKIKRMIKI